MIEGKADYIFETANGGYYSLCCLAEIDGLRIGRLVGMQRTLAGKAIRNFYIEYGPDNDPVVGRSFSGLVLPGRTPFCTSDVESVVSTQE